MLLGRDLNSHDILFTWAELATIPGISVGGDKLSPIIFLHLQKSTSFAEDSSVLQQIVDLVKHSANLIFLARVNIYAHMQCNLDTLLYWIPGMDHWYLTSLLLVDWKHVLSNRTSKYWAHLFSLFCGNILPLLMYAMRYWHRTGFFVFE